MHPPVTIGSIGITVTLLSGLGNLLAALGRRLGVTPTPGIIAAA